MVAETRRRVAEILGEREAEARVRLGRMDDLAEFDDGTFDLVVSLGVLHNAQSGPAILLAPATLDAELHRFDLQPELPTTIGRTSTGEIRRVSANGLYRKRT
jgi:hypothetical protein